jgi:hypothetical protein
MLGSNAEFIEPSKKYGEYRVVTMHLMTPVGTIVLTENLIWKE